MDPPDEDEDLALAFILNALFAEEDGIVDDGEGLQGDNQLNVRDENIDARPWRILNDAVFYDNFRMNRGTFEVLVNVIGNHLYETNRLVRLRTPVDLSVLYTVWILANPDTFRSTGLQFSKPKSTIHFHYIIVIECLRELAPRYIKWPDEIERDIIKTSLERRFGNPGVIGCIDGTNITVTAPLEQPRRFINRHHQYSVIAQAVCDHRMLFRDVFVGQPGSVGDARTFSRSPLSTNLLTGEPYISEGEHLLGDGAYPLLEVLLKPFLDNENLNRRRRRHNALLSACRALIERSFGLLKGKFRRLIKRFQSFSLEYCIDTIVASFVLHNFIILGGEECPGPYRAFGRRVWNESDIFPSTGEHFMVQARFTPPRNGRKQYIWGSVFMGHPLTDDVKAEVRLSVWANNQWKKNAFIFKFDHGACTALLFHARSLADFVFEPHEIEKCPLMPFGHREIKNQTFDPVFPHFPVMPYGRYLFEMRGWLGNKTAVLVGDVEVMPRV